jgi:hypothetical protein
MAVATWQVPNNTDQVGAEYKNALDGGFAVASRFVSCFAPNAQPTPDMTVQIQPGHIFNAASAQLVEVAAQNTASFIVPSLLPRIDRVVGDQITGVISVITGTESSSPVAPAIPGGKVPIARILLQTTTSAISNAMITDERAMVGSGGSGSGFGGVKTIAAAATTDIGSVSSNYVFVTGGSTITSFGSSANVTSPVYIVQFAGTNTLINSGSLQVPPYVNTVVNANDMIVAVYQGSGVWYVPSIWSVRVGSNSFGNRTVSSAAPSGGANLDVWLQV